MTSLKSAPGCPRRHGYHLAGASRRRWTSLSLDISNSTRPGHDALVKMAIFQGQLACAQQQRQVSLFPHIPRDMDADMDDSTPSLSSDDWDLEFDEIDTEIDLFEDWDELESDPDTIVDFHPLALLEFAPEAEQDTPRPGQIFDSPRDGIRYLNEWAASCGYGLATNRSKRDRHGDTSAVYIRCNRGGVYSPHVSDADRQRRTSTRITECPFRITLRRRDIRGYYLTIESLEHNHEPSRESTHPVHRRAVIQKSRAELILQLDQGVPIRHILTSLHKANHPFIQAADLYNLRQNVRQSVLQGRQSIQALLQDFPRDGSWDFRYNVRPEDNTLYTLFGIHKSSLALLQKHSFVLWMDCTYKTNRYNMPLLNIVGVSSVGATFFAGFAFLQNEREESYRFALQSLRDILQQGQITMPSTIFTDKEQALLNALNAVLPEAKSMLCLWHINQNIYKKARPLLTKWVLELMTSGELNLRTPDERRVEVVKRWQDMRQKWISVTFATNISSMERRWERFKLQYKQPLFIDLHAYIHREWILDSGHRFLRCYTRDYLHFDQLSTSRNEGAHHVLKSDLGVS